MTVKCRICGKRLAFAKDKKGEYFAVEYDLLKEEEKERYIKNGEIELKKYHKLHKHGDEK